MNCKPGDLAFIVGIDSCVCANSLPNPYGIDAFKMIAVDMRGTIVKCIESYIADGEVGWHVEPREVAYKGIMNNGLTISGTATLDSVPDRILRPIRGGDLGEDMFTEEELPSDYLSLVDCALR